MSDFSPPPGPPSGGSGASAVGAPAPTAGSGGSTPQAALLSYAAAALGLLAFIWGFLDWLSSDNGVGSDSASGYETIGAAVVGLLLAAGLLAGVSVVEKKDITLAPAAVSVAGLLVAFGELVNHGDGVDAGIGLILAFITAILQTAALIVAWLVASKRMPALGGGSSSGSRKQQHGPGQYAFGPQGFQAPQGFQGPQGFQAPQGFQGPQGYGGPQGAPQFAPPPGPGYGPPPQGGLPGYGTPPGAPSYGAPTQESTPSSYDPPPGQPQGPPPGFGTPQQPGPQGFQGPQGSSQSGPPSDGDESSRTQVLPRFQASSDERPADRPGE